jgi:hypothetical protein
MGTRITHKAGKLRYIVFMNSDSPVFRFPCGSEIYRKSGG